eukprot:TRINITY_DN14716_c0_g1_i2.p2 TRINITY_DN14716_c0_g1~~TRINITY_DN14716_c0_g1_i2.p2  ORF type:complete len:355 (+),score=38.39 TRINITY_DN14716_c0_g1_i2:1315-2379(+)
MLFELAPLVGASVTGAICAVDSRVITGLGTALTALGGTAHVDLIEKFKRSSDPHLRAVSILAAADKLDPWSVLNALRDPDEVVNQTMLNLLLEKKSSVVHDPLVAHEILGLFNSTNTPFLLRQTALQCLQPLSGLALESLMPQLDNLPEGLVVCALNAMPKPVPQLWIPQLLSFVSTAAVTIQFSAVVALTGEPDRPCPFEDSIGPLLRNQDLQLARAALRCLAGSLVNHVDAAFALCHQAVLLSWAGSVELITATVEQLSPAPTRSVAALIDTVLSVDQNRIANLRALCRYHAIIPLLQCVLEDSNIHSSVCVDILHSLHSLGAKAVPLICQMFRRPECRITVAQSLSSIFAL